MQKTIKENTSAEIVQKKSRFIANLIYVTTEQEAEEKIKEIKKKYYDAKHNCYAYSIANSNGIINKMSDDGEPSGTAGAPMLSILNKQELVNVLIVVTRYFGGILLGTGGLVRAYSQAATEAIENAELIYEILGYEVEIVLEYSEFEKFQYYCRKNNILIINTEYDNSIKCKIEVTEKEKEKIEELMQEGTLKINKFEIIQEKNIQKNIEK